MNASPFLMDASYADQARGSFLAESSAGQLERHFATCKACDDAPLGFCDHALKLIEPYLKPQTTLNTKDQ